MDFGSAHRTLLRFAVVLAWLAPMAAGGAATGQKSKSFLPGSELSASSPAVPGRWIDPRSDAVELAESALDPDKSPPAVLTGGSSDTALETYDRRGRAFALCARRDQRPRIFRPLRLGGADQDPDTPTGA